MKRLLFVLAIGLVAGGLGLAYGAANIDAFDETGCLSCHDDSGLTKVTEQEGKTSLYVDGEALESSAHRSLDCTTCHTSSLLLHSASNISPLTKLSLAEKCGSCHQDQSAQYLESTHGVSLAGGNTDDVPSCTTCHSTGGDTHSIIGVSEPDSPVYKKSIAQTCATCHDNEGLMANYDIPATVYENYISSVHGQTQQLDIDQVATCSSCHGSHDITSVNGITPSLAEKCGSCHQDQSSQYLGSIHGTGLAEGNNDVASCPDCHSTGGDTHSIINVSEPGSPVYKKSIAQTCATCHDNEGLMANYDIPATVYENYISSVHGQTQQLDIDQVATCSSCHGSHDITSVNGITPSLAEKCGSCHQDQSSQYLGSIHGTGLAEGNNDVASCPDCHSTGGDTHSIINVSEPGSPVYKKSIAQTCATCHDNEGLMAKYDISATVYETYNNFFHGKAMSLATEEQIARMNYATCNSCHGSHDIMKSENPGSPVANLENLAETCRQCHDGASTAFASSYHLHQEASTEHQLPTFIANVFYAYFLIPAMVVFGTSFILLDLIRSFRQHRRWRKDGKE